jgi:multiple sugar transport system permease protein
VTTGAAIRSPRAGGLTRLAGLVEPLFYVGPAVIVLGLVMLFPLVVGFSYSVRDIELLDPFSGGFVGLEHFRALARDAVFREALVNTLWWTFGSVLFQFAFGLLLALLLNRAFPGKGVVQALVFLPWAVPSFLIGLNFAWLLNPVVGPIPHWLTALGLMSEPVNILAYPDTAMWGPIVANVWYGIPFFAITLLAALQSIPEDIYEAAEIDGASRLQAFLTLTLPLLTPVIAITVLLRTVWIANFADLIVVMTGGGPADTTQTVATYIFTQAFRRLDFGYASAIAVVLLLLLLAYSLCILYLRQRLLVGRA